MNVNNEGVLFGADATEVVWFAELTEEMVAGLNSDMLIELCDELSEAVANICESYGVAG